MRLLKLCDGELNLTPDLIRDIPPYAILSHTWGADGDEVTFQDVSQKRGHGKLGYKKILFCGQQTKLDGLEYFWVDTCCIDKTNSTELAEAINSMFKWYRKAKVCYAYLTDVSAASGQTGQALRLWDSKSRPSKWFTRGWTLQELLAPYSVKFFSVEGTLLGDKSSLESEIYSITKIHTTALRGASLGQFSIAERLVWAEGRETTKEEDWAYCLLGIFDVFLPLIYGEGKANAMARLLERARQQTGISGVSGVSSLHYHPPQKGSDQDPHLILPFEQNDDFVERGSIVPELVEKILPYAKRNGCQRTVIEGLGGVGKTQIALEAAYRVRERDTKCSIFWVPAVTITTFENAYRDIGQALGTPGIEDDKADVKLLVKTALEKCSTDWLLIIDNIDDISLLKSEDLREYMPSSRKGSILFTTRNHEVAVELDASPKDIYTIEQMSKAEALKLLQSRLQELQYSDGQATKDLLNRLAYLPLAIKQAAAYMARSGITTSTYLQYCHKSDEKQIQLLSAEFEDRWRYSRKMNPIATTWLISFRHMQQTYPLAVEYLKFICFLAEKDIPVLLLPHGEDQQAEDEAVGVLKGYAFISMREQGNAFDIHRLVRLATRNWIKPEWGVCYTKVIQRLAEVYPYPKHENRQTWMAYMPHAQVALVDRKECGDKEAQADLLYVVADSHDELGKYAEAEEMHRETLELRKLVLGAEHPETLRSMNNLAIVLNSQGKYEEAEEMNRETLELTKLVLSAEHPDTLDSMNNLALVLKNQGKYEEAEEMHRETLELRKLVLGAEHPSTFDSMNALALVLHSAGKYGESEILQSQALQGYRKHLGPGHPSTLGSMNNLSGVLDSQGKYEEAEEMNRETLELTKLVLGAEHPDTLASMNNLALVFSHQGKYEEAEEIYRHTLELKTKVLGPSHPSTLRTSRNIQELLAANTRDAFGEASDDSEDDGGVVI